MNRQDTGIGGPGGRFPTTIWSDILSAADRTNPRNRELLEELLRTYWKPVFVYVKLSWRKSVEDAKDLTQTFFANLLERDFLSRVAPEKGTFRSYLRRSLENFLIDVERAAAVRRPVNPAFSLESAPGELERLGPASNEDTPERAYDREWFNVLFQEALEALRKALTAEGRESYFHIFQEYCFPNPGSATPMTMMNDESLTPTYASLADRYGVKETDIQNYLTFCRKRLRALLRERIRAYCVNDDDVDRELELALNS